MEQELHTSCTAALSSNNNNTNNNESDTVIASSPVKDTIGSLDTDEGIVFASSATGVAAVSEANGGQPLSRDDNRGQGAMNSSSSGVGSLLAPLAGWCGRAIPHGGFVANVYNLASATLGAGILSVPSGFAASGIAVSVLLLLALCVCTVYTLWLLVAAKERTGLRSYEELARGLLGRGWDHFTAAIMLLFCWGTCVGYAISVRDLLRPVVLPPGAATSAGQERLLSLLTCAVWALTMLPLSLPKEINALRYASFAGVSFVIFFVLCVVVHALGALATGSGAGGRETLYWATSGISAVNGFTLFIYGFLCQVNVFEVHEEMSLPSARRLARDSAFSMGGVCVLNLCAGLFGYLEFGSAASRSLLLLYRPRDEPVFALAFVLLSFKLAVGFAICIAPSRDAVYYSLCGKKKTSDVTDAFNYGVSATLAVLALVASLLLPDIVVVFALLGGTCGAFLSFLFPAAFYYCTFTPAAAPRVRRQWQTQVGVMSTGTAAAAAEGEGEGEGEGGGGDPFGEEYGLWHQLGGVILVIGGMAALFLGTFAAVYEYLA